MIQARLRASQEACGLIDEATILFLAARPGRRRADLFAVALPAGGVQPYSDASGKTSPEMFFGRSDELDELWRPDGSCLVFGGRQLGKTALLEQIRLRHHRPPSQVVVYGSLQGERDVWPLVARLLEGGGVPVQHHHAAGVAAAVQAWLALDRARRILILVDEADTYLEAEMESENDYPSLKRVRDLMQATERRCKFVFAGLHNVQRLARTPNSPLLHFGTPMRVGPLYGRDLGDARDMLVTPLAAAGLVFENATLPSRVLSAVGFYPSLLQTFGDTLINRLNKMAHGRLKAAAPLPIVVTERDIENALDDPQLKENIRLKFQMTLKLDERYRLITLAMLNRMLDRREQGGVAPSLPDVEVQALARGWWPQGFEEDSSLDAFQGLLQEMEGLGVLIRSGDRYAIRSSRIAAMLGGKDQIAQELIELSEAPGPEKLDTGSLRRLDRVSKAPSPLTFRQEGLLLDWSAKGVVVHLALASSALGLDELPASLGELGDDRLTVETAGFENARQLAERMERAVAGVSRNRRKLLVLSGPWLGRDAVDLVSRSGAAKVGGRDLRIVLAPRTVDWSEADSIDDTGRLWDAELLTLSPLGRSGLRQWLRARHAPDDSRAVERLRLLTGGYPQLLGGLAPLAGGDVLAAAELMHERVIGDPLLPSRLGLDDPRLAKAARLIGEFELWSETLPDDLDREGVAGSKRVVGHLQRLGVLERSSGSDPAGRWSLNPLVAALIARGVS